MSVKGRSNQNPKNLGSLELGGKTYSIASLFKIDELDLNKEYTEQAALYAFLLTEMGESERRHAIQVHNRELVYAECDEYYREKYNQSGRKVTESVIKSAIIQDDEYARAVDKETLAKSRYELLKWISRAWEHRGQMLVSLGAHKRAEIGMTGMKIRDKQYDEISEVKSNLGKKAQKR